MKALLHNYVSVQAERAPDATALIMKEQRLTYAQLERQTNQVARLLIAAGCERHDRVCVIAAKSIDALVAILATLKADCIYVPIDPLNPLARIQRIVAACEARCIVADATVGATVEAIAEQVGVPSSVVWIDGAGSWIDDTGSRNQHFAEFPMAALNAYSDEPLECKNRTEDAAHLLFTSGSTGIPKGVIIKHANVTAFVEWAIKYFGTSPSDRISCHPPLHFDLSTFDIYGTFAAGAELHLVPPDLNLLPHKLAEFIRNSELTQWFSVPAALSYLARFNVRLDFPDLHRVLWCGEVLPVPTLVHWMKQLPGANFTNLYGPTETTIASSYYTVPSCPTDPRTDIPIGTACDGEQLFVLDHDLNLLPPGEIGDLYIGGAGLSPGYWRDPEKTKTVFVEHPNTGQRIYRTGDLARFGEDGLVYFVGRADTQIKHRGHRIELGEIEAALNSMGWFSESAVVAINSSGFEGTTICCAYVPASQASDDPATLRSRLSSLLPSYMLPSRWRELSALPKNINGKIDRPQLRNLFQTETTAGTHQHSAT